MCLLATQANYCVAGRPKLRASQTGAIQKRADSRRARMPEGRRAGKGEGRRAGKGGEL